MSESANSNSTGSSSGEEVFLEVEGEIALIRLGDVREKAVILTAARMSSLKRALLEVRSNTGVRGLVIIGSSPDMFCAGADVNVIQSVSDVTTGEKLAQQGQEIFSIIEELPCTTVAAISGPCVGGGFEMALACDLRIALDRPSTRVGLPEVKLGILPGFGGTQRLPRLIGLPGALDIILKAKVVRASEAVRYGMIDGIIREKDLGGAGNTEIDVLFAKFEQYAEELALGRRSVPRKKLSVSDKFLSYNFFGRSIAKNKATGSVIRETKGKYPAPLKAIESAIIGLSHGKEEGYKFERKALGELIVSKESKSLVHIYFSSESATKLGRSVRTELEGKSVTVCGGGVMGAGIAAVSLSSGFPVKIVEPFEKAREKARTHISEGLSRKKSLNDIERSRLLSVLKILSDVKEAAGSDLIVEAIIEDLGAKRELFNRLLEQSPNALIFATNTSSIPLSLIGEEFSAADRLVGVHFFNPVEKMPLVEVIRSNQSSDRAVLLAAAYAAKLGKYPIVVEDVPGFLVNRILIPYLIEASYLLSEGYSIRQIDEAAESFGMPMGPLRLLDEIGLDVASKVSHIMSEHYGERMRGHAYAELLASKGFLGKKSGRGFYVHEGKEATPSASLRVDLGLPSSSPNRSDAPIAERLILAMVNEAVRCFDEGVAGAPSAEASAQIDIGSVMGFGFPPFRGGVMWYAESLGAANILKKLESFEKTLGERFQPAEGIRKRAASGGSFVK